MHSDIIATGSANIPKVGLGTFQLIGKEGKTSIQDAIKTGTGISIPHRRTVMKTK